MVRYWLMGGLCLVGVSGALHAQAAHDAAAMAVQAPATQVTGSTVATPSVSFGAISSIPALTPVSLEVGADLGSATSNSGDPFPIRLRAPIIVDGHEIVPAGATGMGEVVHAKHHGMSGSEGQLILAARWLDVGGQHLRLRSMHLVVDGQSRSRTATAFGMASAVGGPVVAVVGLLITGADVKISQGTIAEAKTAEDFPPAVPAPTAAAVVTPASTPSSIAAGPNINNDAKTERSQR